MVNMLLRAFITFSFKTMDRKLERGGYKTFGYYLAVILYNGVGVTKYKC